MRGILPTSPQSYIFSSRFVLLASLVPLTDISRDHEIPVKGLKESLFTGGPKKWYNLRVSQMTGLARLDRMARAVRVMDPMRIEGIMVYQQV